MIPTSPASYCSVARASAALASSAARTRASKRRSLAPIWMRARSTSAQARITSPSHAASVARTVESAAWIRARSAPPWKSGAVIPPTKDHTEKSGSPTCSASVPVQPVVAVKEMRGQRSARATEDRASSAAVRLSAALRSGRRPSDVASIEEGAAGTSASRTAPASRLPSATRPASASRARRASCSASRAASRPASAVATLVLRRWRSSARPTPASKRCRSCSSLRRQLASVRSARSRWARASPRANQPRTSCPAKETRAASRSQ